LVGVLSHEDAGVDAAGKLYEQPVRVTPDGRYLAFMSNRSLTGYDNRDANSGRPDEEVFLFDARNGRLVCASCNPTGARPVGIERNLIDETRVGETIGTHGLLNNEENWPNGAWLAAQTPTWNGWLQQARYLSSEGRLFFDSADALVPQAIDHTQNVYEYEPAGVGSCAEGSTSFSERSGGCVYLISSGASPAESVFLAASETGDDVFFMTTDRLSAQDRDTSYDVYDAHVCSGAAPCSAPASVAPACTNADSCRAAPSPQPSMFGASASSTFSGPGNAASAPAATTVAAKKKPVARCRKGRVRNRKGRCVVRSRRSKRAGKTNGRTGR
jgi:hypothetical protein